MNVYEAIQLAESPPPYLARSAPKSVLEALRVLANVAKRASTNANDIPGCVNCHTPLIDGLCANCDC